MERIVRDCTILPWMNLPIYHLTHIEKSAPSSGWTSHCANAQFGFHWQSEMYFMVEGLDWSENSVYETQRILLALFADR